MGFRASWTGASGTSYPFTAFKLGQTLPDISGIYIFAKVPFSGVWIEALYVGETRSFKSRLNDGASGHEGLVRAVKAGARHVAVMHVVNDAERLRIETDLRHGLNPLCNRQSTGARFRGFGQ